METIFLVLFFFTILYSCLEDLLFKHSCIRIFMFGQCLYCRGHFPFNEIKFREKDVFCFVCIDNFGFFFYEGLHVGFKDDAF